MLRRQFAQEGQGGSGMKSRYIVTLAALSMVVLAAQRAQAGPYNVRPVPVSGGNLQGVFSDVTGIYVSGPGIDAAADQHSAAWFTNTSSGGSVATFAVEVAPASAENTFGIYSTGDPSKRAAIFDGAAVPGEQAFVSFLANGDVQVSAASGTVVTSGFPDPKSFGFYLDVFDAPAGGFGDGINTTLDYTVFTDDALNTLVNPAGAAQVLVFRGDNQTILQVPPFGAGLFTDSEFILAFEDGVTGSAAGDFADMVVIVESVAPIPEPATGLLLGVGLLTLRRFRRRQS